MKLFHLVLWRISLALIIVLSLWAGFFYIKIVDEVNDEVDDSLEDYYKYLGKYKKPVSTETPTFGYH